MIIAGYPYRFHAPLQRGLTGFWTPYDRQYPRVANSYGNGPKNHARGIVDQGSTSPALNISVVGTAQEGLAWDFPAANVTADYLEVLDSNELWNPVNSPHPKATGELTVATRTYVRGVSGNARSGIVCRALDFGGNGWWLYKEGTSTTWRLAPSAWNAYISVASAGLNEWATCIGRMDANNGNSWFTVNGVSGSRTGDTFDDEPNAELTFGGATADSTQSNTVRVLDGLITYVAIWNRILTDAEVEWLLDNPRGPVVRDNVIDFPFAPAGGAINISPTADSFTVNEYAPSIKLDMGISPSADSFTVNEYAPTVKHDISISPSADAFTVNEYAPTIELGTNINIAPTADAFTVNEYAPTIKLDINLSPSADAFTVGEFAPTIQLGDVAEDGYLPSIRASDSPAVKARKRNARYRYLKTHGYS